MQFTADANKTGRKLKASKWGTARKYISTNAAVFGLEEDSATMPTAIVPANEQLLLRRAKDLVNTRRKNPILGQGTKFINIAKQLGITLVYS